MGMREECKHFQSRTYATGDVARFCSLDLAPEAPWRCPADCSKYERRLADVAWHHGSLIPPPVGDLPDGGDDSIAQLLGQAEEVVNAAAPEVMREIDAAPPRKGFFRRKEK